MQRIEGAAQLLVIAGYWQAPNLPRLDSGIPMHYSENGIPNMEASMNIQKVAISMPPDLVATIDALIRRRGISRSKYIASVLQEKVQEEKHRELKEAYDRIYSDEAIQKEQLETLRFFQGANNSEGQEW